MLPGSVVGLFLACMLVMLGVGIVSPLLGVYAQSLGATGTAVGFLYAAFSVSRAVATPLVGRLSDRIDKRLVIMGGLGLLTLLALFYAFTDSVAALFVVRTIHGVSSAMIIPIAWARVAEVAPRSHEGEMMGTFAISVTLGMAFGPALGGLLFEHGGFVFAFMSLLGLGLTGFLIVWARVPAAPPVGLRPQGSMRAMAADLSVLALAACRFLTACCTATLMGFLPIYAEQIGIGVWRAGLVITISLLASAALQRPMGKLADRMHRILLVVLGICVLGVSLGMVPLSRSFAMMFALALVIGLGRATTVAAAGALIATLGRAHGTGSVTGFVNTAMSLGIGFGPLAAGIFTEHFGLGRAFVAVGGAAIVGSVMAGAVLAVRGGWRAESMTAREAAVAEEEG